MKRILINATQPEELRVAIVDGQQLRNLDIEVGSREQRKSNVYKGRITRIEPSLEAAFIDYGADRHGFLPLKEVARNCFRKDPGGGKVDIKEVLEQGQEVIVQVVKEERGNKGAALTTFISLAGRYLVLMPNNPRAGGVSRRINGEDRSQLREAMSDLTIPKGMGAIARTVGVGREAEELQWDLDYLLQLWNAITSAASSRDAPFLIYQESNIIIRALRDYLRDDIGEVVIDQPEIYEAGREFLEQVIPHSLSKLKLYEDETPLFSRFQVESQIETAFEREVRLPSGGALIIDHTEALTSVDINSARSTRGGGIEETAYNTNLEAADEIARQFRLRDLGGLVVIDFIDMDEKKHQREVEQRLHEAVKEDRARIQFGHISRFGLLEMSRQRLRPSLGEYSANPCPRCSGRGTVRSVESQSLSILRLMEEEAMKNGTGRVVAQLPVAVASFLLNEKRDDIAGVEKRSGAEITMVPNPELVTPHHELRRIRKDQLSESDNAARSYQLEAENPPETEDDTAPRDKQKPAAPKPAVTRPKRETSKGAPGQSRTRAANEGLWSRLSGWIRSLFAAPESVQQRSSHQRRNPQKSGPTRGGNQQRGRQAGGNRNPQSSGQRQDRSSSQQKSGKSGNEGNSGNRNNRRQSQSSSGDNAQNSANNQQQGSNRNRGRRGGRRRRSNNATERTSTQQQQGGGNNRNENRQNGGSESNQNNADSNGGSNNKGNRGGRSRGGNNRGGRNNNSRSKQQNTPTQADDNAASNPTQNQDSNSKQQTSQSQDQGGAQRSPARQADAGRADSGKTSRSGPGASQEASGQQPKPKSGNNAASKPAQSQGDDSKQQASKSQDQSGDQRSQATQPDAGPSNAGKASQSESGSPQGTPERPSKAKSDARNKRTDQTSSKSAPQQVETASAGGQSQQQKQDKAPANSE